MASSVTSLSNLTHWGRVVHICISKLAIIGSDNGLSPGRCQAIIWTNVGLLLIWTLGTNFSEILSKIHIFSFKKMHLKTLFVKWCQFCLSLNVLTGAPNQTNGTWHISHCCTSRPLMQVYPLKCDTSFQKQASGLHCIKPILRYGPLFHMKMLSN